MDTFYWLNEYTYVLGGYLFLMFLWPSAVFAKHLKGKTLPYRLSFCAVTSVVIIDVSVMATVFFPAPVRKVVMGIFLGVFFIMLLYHIGKSCVSIVKETMNSALDVLYYIAIRFKLWCWEWFMKLKRRFPEYAMLFAALVFGMIYFSYGALHEVYSYGSRELYTQHALVYELMGEKISAEGFLPGAMHCFVYCMNALFAIPVYNILLFLEGIHVAMFLLAVYILLQEVFYWRFTPIFVLSLFLAWSVPGTDMIYAMSALQWTIPTEFGLYAPFLCAAFLFRYLKNGFQEKKRYDKDLLLCALSFAAALLIDWRMAVVALVISIPFAIFGLFWKVFSKIKGFVYIPVLFVFVLFGILHMMYRMEVIEVIPDYVSCTGGYIMCLALLMIPVDVLFSWAARHWQKSILQTASFLFSLIVSVVAVLSGNYHGYLFSRVTRYNSAVEVTNSIVKNFPEDSYVVISPTDDLYPVIADGWHEELANFLENTKEESYMLPQEYVFIFVEKKPLYYAQTHFYTGPNWLARDKYWNAYSKSGEYVGTVSREPELITSEISEEEAEKALPDTTDLWEYYINFENRTILESKAYDWCQRFMQTYPYEMNVYYEDDGFVCYYLEQNVNAPYRLGIE